MAIILSLVICNLFVPLVALSTQPTTELSPSTSVLSEELTFSTYFGGSEDDTIHCVVADDYGNIYIAGATSSNDIPSGGALKRPYAGNGDYYVTKVNATGHIVYTTYIGGAMWEGYASLHPSGGCWIDVDDIGRVYMTGYTVSEDFPVVNAWDDTYSGTTDAFALRLSATGIIQYSTYLGGNGQDVGTSISVDDFGNAYVTGTTESTDFPVLNAFDDHQSGDRDVFISKLDSTGQLSYSTYIGGGLSESSRTGGSTVDGSGNAYIVGNTNSLDFPTVNAYDDSCEGISGDLFFCKINTTGHLLASSFFGGSATDDHGNIAVDSAGNIYISGHGSGNFPKTHTLTTNHNMFVAKFDSSGENLIYSAAFGGYNADNPYGLEADDDGCVFLTGSTYSSDFPMENAYDDLKGGYMDSFLVKLSSGGDHILFSSYFGGNSVEYGLSLTKTNSSYVYLAGITNSTDFPLASPIDSTSQNVEGFLLRIEDVWSDIPPTSTTSTTTTSTTTTITTTSPSTTTTPISISTSGVGLSTVVIDGLLIAGIGVEVAIIVVFLSRRQRDRH